MAIASLGATVAYFVIGAVFFAAGPLNAEFRKYPLVYRSQESMKGVWPIGIAGMLLSMVAITAIYALSYNAEGPAMGGGLFGALIGAFSVGSFVLHNHVNLNIGARLTAGQAVAYFVQWTLVGMVIGLLYHPMAR
jgi:hypothetical protein